MYKRQTYASGRWDMNRAGIRPRRYLMYWTNWMKWQKAVLCEMAQPLAPTLTEMCIRDRVWDAINDPIFGMIMDKVHFKKGDRKSVV